MSILMLTLTETLAIFAQAGQYWFRVSANGCALLDSAAESLQPFVGLPVY